MEQMAIFLETDALQFELGNIVEKTSASGNKTYDVTHNYQHKDRYSSLAMANDYVCELEKRNKAFRSVGDVYIGESSRLPSSNGRRW